jgi:hypothetical protein
MVLYRPEAESVSVAHVNASPGKEHCGLSLMNADHLHQYDRT